MSYLPEPLPIGYVQLALDIESLDGFHGYGVKVSTFMEKEESK